MSEFMVDFMEEHSWRVFRYGDWDCVLMVLHWLDEFNAAKGAVIEKFLDETNYEKVKDENSYYRYLVELGVKNHKDLAQLFLDRGFTGTGKDVQEGDLFINPDLSMGVAINWNRGLFLLDDGRMVIAPARVGSITLSCRQ